MEPIDFTAHDVTAAAALEGWTSPCVVSLPLRDLLNNEAVIKELWESFDERAAWVFGTLKMVVNTPHEDKNGAVTFGCWLTTSGERLKWRRQECFELIAHIIGDYVLVALPGDLPVVEENQPIRMTILEFVKEQPPYDFRLADRTN